MPLLNVELKIKWQGNQDGITDYMQAVNIVNSIREDKTMDEKEKDKIVKLKEKADKKKIYIRGLPREIGEKDETVSEINRAFVEDEMIRKNAQRHAENYLKDLDQEEKKFPNWMWFVTGMLFTIVIEVFFLNTTVADLLVRYFYGN